MKYRIQASTAGHKSAEQVPAQTPEEEVVEPDTETKDEE